MSKWRTGTRRFIKSAFLTVPALILFSSGAPAAEMRVLVPSYEGEELAKVREWEKTWVGKRIDKTNLDQVKEFLLPSLVRVMKDPEYMNAKEYWFDIVPYQQAHYSKGQIEMIKKNAPIAKIEEDDSLVDYENMAGFLFPEPKSGIEAAYNLDMQTYGDSRFDGPCGSVVEPRTGFDRVSCRDVTQQYWSGRSFVEPYGNHPKNKKGIRLMQHSLMLSPPDFNGNVILFLKYNDTKREADQWIYMKRFRRTRRNSAAQRSDQIDGTEMIYDDSPGMYGDHIIRNTYKILGRKELLLARHQDLAKVQWADKSGIYNGLQRERINTYMVETKYKRPNYAYSKTVWYLDPELWIIMIKQCWDEDGKFWRYQEESYMKVPLVDGKEYAYNPAVRVGWDMVGRHASHNKTTFTEKVGKSFPLRFFSVHSIQKSR